jgi:non-heme chloroperoxidase
MMSAEPARVPTSGFVTTADGVRIHYLDAGPTEGLTRGPAILLVPAWTIPAWIWQQQIDHLSKSRRVVAMDSRSQGDSAQTPEGLYPAARARDIRAVITELHLAPVVLVGWSIAVTEVVSYVDQFGTRDIAGLVLVDDDAGAEGSVGALTFIGQIQRDRQSVVPHLIRTVFFKKAHVDGYVDRVIEASMRVPADTAVALLVGKFATDNRSVLARIDKPTLVCASRSAYMASILDMQKSIVGSRLEIFEDDGHALFVDNPAKFNRLLDGFLGNLRA